MSLTTGDRLGPYEVIAPLGQGGMGEVYRARDTTLDRDVALKILPDVFASDPDRLMRFEREAKTLAALNHPNIAQVYGVEQQALVMELVEGEDLSEHIERGPMDLDEALPLARQIADALEAAHESGIIHRDLKPANIKVRADGTVKVLDFGLAKAVQGVQGDGSGSRHQDPSPSSATMTSPAMTAMGMIIGTAAYMSPEQARGRTVDQRSDIWAFGCVLYEMLTGRRAFEGDDVSITLAGVLKEDVDWDVLPDDLPTPIRRLLRRCLEKDPRRRLSAIGDARLELDEHERSEREPAPPVGVLVATSRSTGRLVAAVAAAVVVTTALTLWMSGTFSPESVPRQRLTVLAPPGESIAQDSANVAVSPDGRRVAFVTGSRGDTRLWIRTLDELVPREVEDSTGAALPFWSPDSATMAFFAGGKLMTVPGAGGRPQAIADAPDARGGTWNADGVIVFAPNNAGALSRVSSNGGPVTAATTLSADMGETGHRFPTFLPDGRHFLFAALPATAGQFDIHVGALDSTDRELVLAAESSPVFAEPGYLVYSRRSVLVAHPFDASRRALTGEAIPLGDAPGEMNVQYASGWATSVTRDGDLAYLTAGRSRSRLTWFDGSGRETAATEVAPGPYITLSLSRDGRRAALTQLEAPHTSVWLADIERGGLTPVTTLETGWNGLAVMSPEGGHVAFSSDRNGPTDLFVRALDAAEAEPLYQSDDLFKHPTNWSPDGALVVFSDLSPETGDDLWTIQPDGDRTPTPVVRSPGDDLSGTVSPDGRWMAYMSDRAGRMDAYVQAFPGPGTAHRITTGGTLEWGLWWRTDGRQLLVIDADLQLLRVDVQTSPSFEASLPRVVGQLPFTPVYIRSIDATPDLERLLAIVPEQADGSRSLTVVQNWQGAIGSRTP